MIRPAAVGARAVHAPLAQMLVLGVGIGGCVGRTIEGSVTERLSVEEICSQYCEMQLTCPKVREFSSDCYESCVDPWATWPNMSEECAHVRVFRSACFVDLGCEGLPDPPIEGQSVEVCTAEEVAPGFEYSPENCGHAELEDDG